MQSIRCFTTAKWPSKRACSMSATIDLDCTRDRHNHHLFGTEQLLWDSLCMLRHHSAIARTQMRHLTLMSSMATCHWAWSSISDGKHNFEKRCFRNFSLATETDSLSAGCSIVHCTTWVCSFHSRTKFYNLQHGGQIAREGKIHRGPQCQSKSLNF